MMAPRALPEPLENTTTSNAVRSSDAPSVACSRVMNMSSQRRSEEQQLTRGSGPRFREADRRRVDS